MRWVYLFDLLPFVGSVTIVGGTNLHHGMREGSTEGGALESGKHDVRKLLRYLVSDTPFIVKGKTSPDWEFASRKI